MPVKICETCGGPCVYQDRYADPAQPDDDADPAPDDVGVSFMATWVEPEKPADDRDPA